VSAHVICGPAAGGFTFAIVRPAARFFMTGATRTQSTEEGGIRQPSPLNSSPALSGAFFRAVARSPCARARASDRGQPAPARGVQSVRAALEHANARLRRKSNLRTYVCPGCSAADSVLFYSHQNHFRPKANPPNATGQTALNSALCPATTKGTGIGKSSRTAARSLRAALLTRSPLRANRQTKRREKQS
jgi:hypothetical protein